MLLGVQVLLAAKFDGRAGSSVVMVPGVINRLCYRQRIKMHKRISFSDLCIVAINNVVFNSSTETSVHKVCCGTMYSSKHYV